MKGSLMTVPLSKLDASASVLGKLARLRMNTVEDFLSRIAEADDATILREFLGLGPEDFRRLVSTARRIARPAERQNVLLGGALVPK